MADHDMVKRFNALFNIIDHFGQTSKPAQQLSSEDLCLILPCLNVPFYGIYCIYYAQ